MGNQDNSTQQSGTKPIIKQEKPKEVISDNRPLKPGQQMLND